MSNVASISAVSGRSVNKWLVLIIVCMAQFMVILDGTIVNVALPSIERGLHFSQDNLQWVINGYTLVFGGFLLLGGRPATCWAASACSSRAWSYSPRHRCSTG